MTGAASAAAVAASAAAIAATSTSTVAIHATPSRLETTGAELSYGSSGHAPAPEVDVEDFVIAYLCTQSIVPSGQVAARIPATLPTPFILVQRVAGGDDLIVDRPTVSVHSFHTDQTAASDIARAVHHAMRQLRPKTVVTMPDSSTASPYAPTLTEQTPIFVEWEPSGGGLVIARYVARYLIKLRLPAITSF